MSFKLCFIGIGAYRSGTTWLVHCLREHSDVCIPHIKELEFFNKKYEKGTYIYSNYNKGISWYKEQFRECRKDVKCLGEYSNAYLYDKDVPRLIKNMFPDIKLLLCLRNPVDRAYSGYLWETLNFERDKFAEVDIEELKKSVYIEMSLYGKYIRNYLKIFKSKDIHVILFDDILKRPEDVIKSVYKFLHLKPFTPSSLRKKINPASQARSRLLTYVFDLRLKLEKENLGIVIDMLKRLRLYTFLQKLYSRVNRQPIIKKPLTQKQRNELKDLFLSDIEETEKLLGIDLSSWK